MLPDQVSNPGPLTYESGALPIALRGPAMCACVCRVCVWGEGVGVVGSPHFPILSKKTFSELVAPKQKTLCNSLSVFVF